MADGKRRAQSAITAIVADDANALAVENELLTSRTAKHFVGYVIWDITAKDFPLVFGTYNDRKEEKKQVAKLAASMLSNGIRRIDKDMVINVGVEDVDLGDTSKALKEIRSDINTYPTLKEVLKPMVSPRVIVFGGQHRLAAVKAVKATASDYIEKDSVGEMQDAMEALASARARMEELVEKKAEADAAVERSQAGVSKGKGHAVPEEVEQWSTRHQLELNQARIDVDNRRINLAAVEAKVKSMKTIIQHSGKWLLAVYNKSELFQ